MRYENNVLVEAWIDSGLREHAECILSQLGISASEAITLYYRQIILQKGLPFSITLPTQTGSGDHSDLHPAVRQFYSSQFRHICQ